MRLRFAIALLVGLLALGAAAHANASGVSSGPFVDDASCASAPSTAGTQAVHHAGLVIVFGEDRVETLCIEFTEDEISGAELLRRSGLPVVLTGFGGLGTGVCRIDDVGCSDPTDCFCQCRGAECSYWAYYALEDGAWRYLPIGASQRRLHDGDADAWVWGSGRERPTARAQDAPLVFGLVLSLALLLFVIELSRPGLSAKTVSMLAVVIVAAAAARVPTLPAGANAFFFLVIVAGYVFGARLGFLVGAGAMFVSAFVVGGFGPWLPFQMFASGWVGMTAGWLGQLLARPLRGHKRVELLVLAAFAGAWGFLFGAIMNLWFWPFVAGGESISWRPGMGLSETLDHYWSFYLLTSAGWDAWRAAANVALVLVAGRPVLDALVRYRDRFQITFD